MASPGGAVRHARRRPVAGCDLAGAWRFATGVRVEFRRVGDAWIGTRHDLSADLRAVGHRERMKAHRLRPTRDGAYARSALVPVS